MNEENLEMLKIAYKALDDKFAEDIVILDIREVSTMADYFIIASGRNPNQLKAMADEVDEKLHKHGLKQNCIEGYHLANWILIDFSDVMIHLFAKEDREFYRLERVWGDAKIVELPK